ncbi:MAG: Swt1 family HEPN domain-containing protein [Candidatus Eremiobacterota bacterium]
MNFDFENPFADYGNIVRGERFIGRKESLKVIENRIIRPNEPGNLAIIGEPRIGKSSLVYKAIMEKKSELVKGNRFPVWLNLATYDKSSIFFRSLVTESLAELENVDKISPRIQQAANKVFQDKMSWTEGYGKIQRYFEKIKNEGLHIIFILDEFDHARYLFKGDISGFQGLRELSYRPEWRVTFVTTSRRSIRDIEMQTQAISTFDGIFYKYYLGMFSDEDKIEYFAKFNSSITSLTCEAKEKIEYYCGGFPYILEMLGYEIIECYREKHRVDIDETVERIKQSLLDQYDRMIDLLKEDKSLNKLLQILFGPIIDILQTDIEQFLKYGLIITLKDDVYQAFSKHFNEYLNIIERYIDIWPLWSETERKLRFVIAEILKGEYGIDWVNKLEKAQVKLKPIFDECKKLQLKEEKTFGNRASKDLLDFTYPRELFSIIFSRWDIFKNIFGKDQNYWNQRAELLSKVRNPLAHNRSQVINDYEKDIAEGYCKEILSALLKF